MAEWPFIVPARAASLAYPQTNSTRRRRRKATPALAALGLFSAVPSVPLAAASPLPIPFLDFLYPPLRLSVALSTSTTTAGQLPSIPPSSRICEAKRSKQSCEGLVEQQKRQTVHERKRRDISKGIKVPVKFEPSDFGWIVAEKWDLHGSHRRSDAAPLANDTVLDTEPTLRYTDSYGGSVLVATSGKLDLPQGWNSSHLARHENYDPVVVSVFAVVVVLSILTTIGLCRWRARKLRKLRDVERMLKEVNGEVDLDEEEKKNRKAKDNKRRKSSGKSTAMRRLHERVNVQMRKKYRSKGAATAGTAHKVAPSSEPDISTNNVNAGADPDSDSEVLARTTSIDTRPPDHAVSASLRPSVDLTSRTSPSSDISRSSSRASRPPRSTINEPTALQAMPAESSVPTSLPPAYPATGRLSISRRSEKAPLRGLEAEYDERDIATYHVALRDRSEGTTSVPVLVGEALERESAPPFAVSVLKGTSRIVAGATRSAHVATDDKHVLERLRNMADEPVTLAVDDGVHGLQAPTFHEMDEWETQRQLEEHNIVSTPPEPLEIDVGPSASRSTTILPPPPSFIFTSTAMVQDPSSGYSLGPVWGSMGGSNPPSTRTPSSPPEEDGNEALLRVLLPSGPPQLDDETPIASAPPAWDDEEIAEVVDQPSAPPLLVSSPARTILVIPPPDEDDQRDGIPNSEHVIVSSNRDTDNDSISGSSIDGEDGTWRTQLRTRSRDGRGLPRYEP